MNLPDAYFCGKKIGMKPGFRLRLILLLIAILSLFSMTKLTGMSNDAALINANLVNKSQLGAINSSDNSHADHRQNQVLHGWCQYRGQHLTSV